MQCLTRNMENQNNPSLNFHQYLRTISAKFGMAMLFKLTLKMFQKHIYYCLKVIC